ncbi:MAG: patatin-like phospholipase family protein [Vicinamibacteria bacterium]|nr:patatin-like phospholipase family protein [Vicinamibacteria bacterium]
MKPLYLALSGGGGHAAAHAGVLFELERAGIPVAGVAGVSGGALVAAAWAGGADLEKLIDQASRLHPWFWVRGWGGGLLSGTKLGALIDEFLPVATFEGLRCPLAVVATQVDTGEKVVFTSGPLRDRVRASCSFPGVFPPMVLDGVRYYDGGVSEVIPVRPARDLAGEGGVVLALDCNSGTKWPGAASFVAVALRAGLTLLRGRTRGELLGADMVIAPKMGDSGWMQPRRIPQFFEAGREALRSALPELRRLLEG